MANNIVYHKTEFMLIFLCVVSFPVIYGDIEYFCGFCSNILQKKMLLLRSVKMKYDRGMRSPRGSFMVLIYVL